MGDNNPIPPIPNPFPQPAIMTRITVWHGRPNGVIVEGSFIEVSISQTHGIGNTDRFRIKQGTYERWERSVGGKCTLQVFLDGGSPEVGRIEHIVIPGDNNNTFEADGLGIRGV
jgi:hypothetical protein